MVSASWVLRKSSNRSACEPRAPRWTSEMNKVRQRRSGLSSLKESLPMHVPLTDSHDSPMPVRADAFIQHDLDGKPVPTFPDHARAPLRISCTSPCSPHN